MIPATFHPNLIAQWVLERNLHWSVMEQLIVRMKTPTLIIWGKHDVIFGAPTHLQRWHHLLLHFLASSRRSPQQRPDRHTSLASI
jgi:pimeloyl-ACP methyl ester carboxylesterase